MVQSLRPACLPALLALFAACGHRDCDPPPPPAPNPVSILIEVYDPVTNLALPGVRVRVIDAYQDWFEGYLQDPAKELSKTFEDVQGYDDIVMLRDIEVESHCEHHMAPFLGKAYVAYMPTNRVVGISKLAKVVTIFARRLQNQETLTQQIAYAINDSLRPAGVAVLIDAAHQCMTTRGLHHRHVSTLTTQFTGVFKTDDGLRQRFLDFVNRR